MSDHRHVEWKRPESSYHDSKCGRFAVRPIYRSTVNPSGYKLIDSKTKQVHWVDRVREAKELADSIVDRELNPPKKLSDAEIDRLF